MLLRNLVRLLKIPTILLIGVIVLTIAPAAAQVIVPPAPPYPPPVMPPFPPPAPPRNFVVVAEHTVDAVIDGPVANVTVKQVFRNDGPAVAEGVYIFPLPKHAAVADFQMTIDGETVEGKLMSAAEARAIYERIVRDLRDPALLEYVGQGLFQASVFPIPAGETRTVAFTYAQTLDLADGLYRFNYPLSTRRYSAAPVEEVGVQVELVNQPGLRTIYSPNYPLQIERSADDAAVVTYSAESVQPEGDFDLYFGVDEQAIGLNLLSYKPASEDGYFVLLLAPTVEVDEEAVVARDLIVVADVSGSMQGTKLAQAQDALSFIVESLNPEDRFNLIAFSTGTRPWKSALQPVTAKTREEAIRWVDDLQATGSTDINRALLEALARLNRDEDAARPAYIIFLTDGQPTQGETVAANIIANAQANAPEARSVRLFTFGIGYDVNTDLLSELSQMLGGRDSYVRPDERVDEAVGAFYAQISTPVLSDVAVAFDEKVTVSELYPHPLPDLFAGEQLVLTGRYDEGGPVEVTLTGSVNGVERLYVYPDQELTDGAGEPFVARLWATRKLGVLLDEVRRSGPNNELIDAIVDLSLRYGIVTPYTSYLVLEPGMIDGMGGGPAAPAAAPLPVDQDALRSTVEAAAAQEAAAPAAGAMAVEQRLMRQALGEATVAAQEDTLRYIAGRTFRLQSVVLDDAGNPLELWVDVNFTDEMTVTEVVFGSDEYFDLLETSPELAAWLSLSPMVVVVTGEDEAVRVVVEE
jgi:Ca-activated chloride channel family protein